MGAYLIDQSNEHAMSLMQKMRLQNKTSSSFTNDFILCTRDELKAWHDGAIVKLPEKTIINTDDK